MAGRHIWETPSIHGNTSLCSRKLLADNQYGLHGGGGGLDGTGTGAGVGVKVLRPQALLQMGLHNVETRTLHVSSKKPKLNRTGKVVKRSLHTSAVNSSHFGPQNT